VLGLVRVKLIETAWLVFSPSPDPCKVIEPLPVVVGCEITVGVHVCPVGEFVTFSDEETKFV